MSLVRSQTDYFIDNTTVHGLPQTKNAPNWALRVFWAILFTGLVGALTYHAYTQINQYLTYPYAVQIAQIANDSLTFPAVTVCNLSPMKKSGLFCETSELMGLLQMEMIGSRTTCMGKKAIFDNMDISFPVNNFWRCKENTVEMDEGDKIPMCCGYSNLNDLEHLLYTNPGQCVNIARLLNKALIDVKNDKTLTESEADYMKSVINALKDAHSKSLHKRPKRQQQSRPKLSGKSALNTLKQIHNKVQNKRHKRQQENQPPPIKGDDTTSEDVGINEDPGDAGAIDDTVSEKIEDHTDHPGEGDIIGPVDPIDVAAEAGQADPSDMNEGDIIGPVDPIDVAAEAGQADSSDVNEGDKIGPVDPIDVAAEAGQADPSDVNEGDIIGLVDPIDVAADPGQADPSDVNTGDIIEPVDPIDVAARDGQVDPASAIDVSDPDNKDYNYVDYYDAYYQDNLDVSDTIESADPVVVAAEDDQENIPIADATSADMEATPQPDAKENTAPTEAKHAIGPAETKDVTASADTKDDTAPTKTSDYDETATDAKEVTVTAIAEDGTGPAEQNDNHDYDYDYYEDYASKISGMNIKDKQQLYDYYYGDYADYPNNTTDSGTTEMFATEVTESLSGEDEEEYYDDYYDYDSYNVVDYAEAFLEYMADDDDCDPKDEDCSESFGIDESMFDFIDSKNFSNIYQGLLQISMVADMTDIINMMIFPKDVFDKHGFTLAEMLVSCSFNGKGCDETDFSHRMDVKHGNCYTFNTAMNATKSVSSTRLHGFSNGLKIILNIKADEYVGMLSPDSGIKVMVHYPWSVALPTKQGFNVGTGDQTSIGIVFKEIKRLKEPHSSNCTDVYPEPLQRMVHPSIDYTTEMCQTACVDYYLQSKCTCLERDYGLSTGLPVCKITDKTQRECRISVYKNMSLDRSSSEFLGCDCRPPCYEAVYQKFVSRSQWPSESFKQLKILQFSQNPDDKLAAAFGSETFYKTPNHMGEKYLNPGESLTQDQLIAKNLVNLHVYYEVLNYEQITEEPSFTFVTLLANIGGILGLYIGMSICTMCEFIQYLVSIIFCTMVPKQRPNTTSPNKKILYGNGKVSPTSTETSNIHTVDDVVVDPVSTNYSPNTGHLY